MGEKNLPFIKGKDLMERNICPMWKNGLYISDEG